ncbi:hypothetical protein EV368DRAFT_68996 [Lentinula lateritia]|nr:hypothetical protein EV368DRAFT_68996 [Lentinula lateritia]
MPTSTRPPSVPPVMSKNPYCLENECLITWVWLLELQLVASCQENLTLTSALCNALVSLEAHQKEFQALEHTLPGPSGQTLLERFQDMENDLCSTREDWNRFQQALVDASNSLVEELQEEVHHFHDCGSFLEQMVCEFPKEGFYKVSLPPVLKLEGELAKMSKDLCQVATFAHRLYCSTLGNALHHHNWHLGGLIEAVLSFLRHGMESSGPDIVSHNFRVALEYMQAICGIHWELNI